jgi:hypothetical protein
MNTNNFVRIFPRLVKNYNSAPQKRLGMSPNDAAKPENEEIVWKRKYGYLKDLKPKKSDIKLEDPVRISRLFFTVQFKNLLV